MHILIVSQYFYPEDFKVNDVAFDFVKKGHQVTVFTGKPNYPKGKFFEGYSFLGKNKETIKGVEVIRCPIILRGKGGALRLILNYLSFVVFGSYYALFKIKNKKYDTIFCHLTSPITAALPAIILKKRFKIKLHIWILDIWPESVTATTRIKNAFIISGLDKLVKYIYKQSDSIFISSSFFKTSIQRLTPTNIYKVEYLPNWAEDVFENNSKITYTMPSIPEGFNIMFAGNVGEAQDFEAIVNANKEIKDENINWLIVGDGRKMQWLKTKIETDNIKNIFLLGRHPIKSMPLFFEYADVMLVSLKNNMVFNLTVPAKIQAYMAMGKIILGMLNGEGQKIINESQSGFCVDAGDYHTLVTAIKKIQGLSQTEKIERQQNAKSYYNNNFEKNKLLTFLENKLMYQ